ncbi:MAG: GNAT family N-acetyltransferase [Myxococcota bacterium]
MATVDTVPISVRLARPADAAAIAEIFLASRAQMTYLPVLHTDDETREWVRKVMMDQLEVWVAEDDSAVRGFVALGQTMLEHLYVRPSDQNRGIGSALLARAKQQRPGGLELWVFQKNRDARRFYLRHGFALARLSDGSDNEEREPDALYRWSGTTDALQ